MTYSQYRKKLSKLSNLYRNAYMNGATIKQGGNQGDYVHCPNANSWAVKYFRSRMKAHRDAYPHHSHQYALDALTYAEIKRSGKNTNWVEETQML